LTELAIRFSRWTRATRCKQTVTGIANSTNSHVGLERESVPPQKSRAACTLGVTPHQLVQSSPEIDILSVITGFDVVMVTLRDGELPHERRSALLLEREGALHSGVFKAMPFGCGLRPQP
jgi:hypothetical protein